MNSEKSPIAASQHRPAGRIVPKKIPPELRRRRFTLHKGNEAASWHKRLLLRLRYDSQFLRSTIQASFALLCIWIGIEFYLFVRWGQSDGQAPFYPRPAGGEGFLPISALISLASWVRTGIINDIHPSGMFIFVAICAIGLLLKKAFCSWLCPVGTLSESLHMLGKKLFGRNLRVPRWLDYPLRSLKYLILLFFAGSVFQMSVPELRAFIESPYNTVADIKMYLFFAQISGFALWTIITLMICSVFVENFWCRYLCPYGALLGALSVLSPLKVTRAASSCIDCGLCTRACPARINVHTASRVWSDECTGCLLCVEACPVKETLDIRTPVTGTGVPNWVFGTLVAGIFVAVTGLAMLTGHWTNAISRQEYRTHFQHIDSPAYEHTETSDYHSPEH